MRNAIQGNDLKVGDGVLVLDFIHLDVYCSKTKQKVPGQKRDARRRRIFHQSSKFFLLEKKNVINYLYLELNPEPLHQGRLAATFDLAAFGLYMIAPVKKSVNHSKTLTCMREMQRILARATPEYVFFCSW